MQDSQPEQIAVRCVLMRGGTSKALFFHDCDVPPVGAHRDSFLKRAMGTPDVMQIDGLGGSRLVTSKAAIISTSKRTDADVDYTFAQVDIERDLVGYDANCGNISSAVGPFAIDEGLVAAIEPVTTVRIYNTNTDKILVARVPVARGKARVTGNCAIAGVPGTGAEILMDYTGTIGAKTGRLLPTGRALDSMTLEDGRQILVSLCDAANPCVFFEASCLGLTGKEMPADLSANTALIETIGEIQSKAGQMMRLWTDWRLHHLPGLPLAVMVAAPTDYIDMAGVAQSKPAMDLQARLFFLGKCHDSMAGTGSICTAAASRIKGSIVHAVMDSDRELKESLYIGHPLGVMAVKVKVITSAEKQPDMLKFSALGLIRTARRLMSGDIYLPAFFLINK